MLITLETALLAKVKGFTMNSCTFYQHNSNPVAEKRYELVGGDSEDEGFVSEDPKNRIAVCIQSELQRWLRDERDVATRPVHRAQVNFKPINMWYLFNSTTGASTMHMYNSYEEALEEALQQALKSL